MQKANVVVLIGGYKSHYYSVFAFLRPLKDQYNITFIGPAVYAGFVAENGFNYRAVPFGFHLLEGPSFLKRLRTRMLRQDRKLFLQEAAEIRQIVAILEPQLILIDSFLTRYFTLFKDLKTRIAIVQVYLPTHRDPHTPPFHLGYIPSPTALSRAWVAILWRIFFIRKKLFKIYLRICCMPQVDHFDSQLPNYAVADFRHDNAGPPLVPAVPEILLAPGVIDYPWRVRRSNQRQYGMTVDTSRLQERSPAIEAYIDQARAQGNKLIYCSLGIMFSRDNARYHRLLDKLRQVAARNPGWSFLAVAPGHVTPPLENFLTVEYAPQLRVLSQAHVFITHGGIHSIQEAIVCGVPMYVLPLADNSDQSGNASRVVYHGLGHRGAIRSESTATLKTKVMDLLTAPRYRANLQAMNNSLHQATDTSEFMDWFLEFSRGVTARQALSAEVGTKV